VFSTLSDEFLLSTVKIEATRGGHTISTGTAFYWCTEVEGDRRSISLITNKHVVDGADGFALHAHIADTRDRSRPSRDQLRLTIERGNGEMPHPDPDVDLIALNITDILNKAAVSGKPVCHRMLGRGQIPDRQTWELFDSVEEVLMVGCPRGISDEYNNMPLVRRGITATSVRRNFNGKQEFMVDLACFPGSSGSPVFFYNQQEFLVYQQPDGSMKPKPKFALMGVLHAGPLVTNAGEIVLNQTPSVTVQTMMHLGQVIRSTRILEIDDLIVAEFSRAASG
jgi:hypothetical protein